MKKNKLREHLKMLELVEKDCIILGIFKEVNEVKVYKPISKKEYKENLEKGNIDELAYNIYYMGREVLKEQKNTLLKTEIENEMEKQERLKETKQKNFN